MINNANINAYFIRVGRIQTNLVITVHYILIPNYIICMDF